ncbi:MAG: SGNH/GDSL hydrolase family protein [Chloroflexota bacterium]
MAEYRGEEKVSADSQGSGSSATFSWDISETASKGKYDYLAPDTTWTTAFTAKGELKHWGMGSNTDCTEHFSARKLDRRHFPMFITGGIVHGQPGAHVQAALPDSAPWVSGSSTTGLCAMFPGALGGMAPLLSWGTNPAQSVDVTVPFSRLNKGTFSKSFSWSPKGHPYYTVKATLTVRAAMPPLYVALGDSYSAGQMPEYVPDGEACFRSTSAYPVLYDENASFWACAGAATENILLQSGGARISHVGKQTKLVTITIGGNDLGLFGLLQACVVSSPIVPNCKDYGAPKITFSVLQQRLVDTYEAIHEHGPAARIFVLGYPNPVTAKLPAGCKALTLQAPPHLGLTAADVLWFHDLIEKLDKTVQAAATESRVATYIAPSGFAGHDVCSANPWFWPLDNSPLTLHPNFQGQHQLAVLLRAAAGPPPG